MKEGRIFYLKNLSKEEQEEILKGGIYIFCKYIYPIVTANKKKLNIPFKHSKKVVFKSRFEKDKYFAINQNILKNRYIELILE